jgi:hypothetical protein
MKLYSLCFLAYFSLHFVGKFFFFVFVLFVILKKVFLLLVFFSFVNYKKSLNNCCKNEKSIFVSVKMFYSLEVHNNFFPLFTSGVPYPVS